MTTFNKSPCWLGAMLALGLTFACLSAVVQAQIASPDGSVRFIPKKLTPDQDQARFVGERGKSMADTPRMPLLMPDNFEALHVVAWRVEEGVPDPHNPLLEPKMPWDAGGVMAHGTVLKDPIDGLWKAWQVSTPAKERLDGLVSHHQNQRRLTYLESKDGVNWYRPLLPFVSWPGYDRTNIIFDMDSGGTAVYASVLVDPRNKEWPYEMFVMRSPKMGGVPNRVGHLPGPKEKLGTYRYHSKDGKDWKLFEGPLAASAGAVDVSYVYREADGSYVSYYKSHPLRQPGDRIIPYDNNGRQTLRCVSRRTSPDGSEWGHEKLVFRRDWRDPDYAQYLELVPMPVEGGYVGFVNYYDATIQTMSLQLAASRDGIHWWRPDRRPALRNGPLGDYGGGLIWQMHHPVIEGDLMYVYYAGTEGLHGAIFDSRFTTIEVGGERVISDKDSPVLPFNSALCRATWQFDRLWALVSVAGGPTLGEAVTKPRQPAGDRLAVNVFVKSGGELRAELLDETGCILPGFSAEDCEPVTGDQRRAIVQWSGGKPNVSAPLKVRFILKRAFLYGYDWVNPTSM